MMKAVQLQALLLELAECLRGQETIENIIVFRLDEDGVPIQEPGYYFGTSNGVTFIQIEDQL